MYVQIIITVNTQRLKTFVIRMIHIMMILIMRYNAFQSTVHSIMCVHIGLRITLHTDISVAVEAKDFSKEKLPYLLKQKQALWKYYRME